MFICMCMYVCMYVCNMCMYDVTCVCMYVCMYVYESLCVCICSMYVLCVRNQLPMLQHSRGSPSFSAAHFRIIDALELVQTMCSLQGGSHFQCQAAACSEDSMLACTYGLVTLI